MPDHAADQQLLNRALELARDGIAMASPNPYVGAVIADPEGNVVGEGTYTYSGVKHAEVLALEAAGAKAHRGTLYINLEPHAHQGRTPPCTDALIAAGVRRVVASMPDPNPKVSGRGFEALRAAGIQVEVGGLQEQAQRLNEAFSRYIRHGVPFVTLKSAMTLDGKIAPSADGQNRSSSGETQRISKKKGFSGTFSGNWITGETARAHVQELRHQHDAILTGVGTVIADNPLLTDRSGLPRRRPLLRVILDSHLHLPLESRIVESAARDKKNDLLVFSCSPNDEKKSQLEHLRVQVEQVPENAQHRPDLNAVLRRLGQLEITSLMIESGSTVNGAALAANAVDKLFLYYAPKIFGGSAIPFAADSTSADANQARAISRVRFHRFGEDFAVEGYLRDPYED
jgi:diaminohydroxyphosphoribosylaminopyrimidine deaminase / 5-amino-6-(5-phosphoribosylamino)uracil reductase